MFDNWYPDNDVWGVRSTDTEANLKRHNKIHGWDSAEVVPTSDRENHKAYLLSENERVE
jgi:hypothetical protein